MKDIDDIYYRSTLGASLASVLDDKLKGFELLKESLDFADKYGENVEKPETYDLSRFVCYLKVTRVYVRAGKCNELSTLMNRSTKAVKVAKEIFSVEDDDVYAQIASIFTPTFPIEKVLKIVQAKPVYGDYKFLVVRAIKTHQGNQKTHVLFLEELDRVADPIIKKINEEGTKYDFMTLFEEFTQSLELIKGYCYLGQIDKATNIINVAEHSENKNYLNAEWESKAHLIVARTYAAQKQFEKAVEHASRISKLYEKEMVISKAYSAKGEKDNALIHLQSAEIEAKKIEKHLDGCRVFLKIAKRYFHIGLLRQARGSLIEAEKRADQIKDDQPRYQTRSYKRLVKMIHAFQLSMSPGATTMK